jgi:hypothetical protein
MAPMRTDINVRIHGSVVFLPLMAASVFVSWERPVQRPVGQRHAHSRTTLVNKVVCVPAGGSISTGGACRTWNHPAMSQLDQ